MLSTVAPRPLEAKTRRDTSASRRAQKPQSWRRVNRARETDEATIRAAIPEGFTRPHRVRDVLDVIEMHPQWALLYKRRQSGLLAVLEALIAVADYDTMTSRPTWEFIMKRTGLPRSTMHRHLRTLRSWHLVATVATGRSAAYAAAGPDGEKINEAAVYVLLVPRRYGGRKLPRKLPVQCAPRPAIHKRPVHKNETPPAVGDYLSNKERVTHARAREEALAETATRSTVYQGGRWAAALPRFPEYRQEILWPGQRRAASKKQRAAAAGELRRRLINVLRPLSVPDVAAAVRDFLIAGWTVKDLQHALQYQPDGTVWPHSGAPETTEPRRLRGWLVYRLQSWRTVEGEPMTSKSQREASELARRRAEHRRQAEEAERRRRLRASPDSPVKAAALARIRQVLNR